MTNERSNEPWNTYTRSYRAEHPEKVKQWRLNSMANELRKAGYTVIEPKEEDLQTQEER